MWFIIGLLLGGFIGTAITTFMICVGRLNKEQEAYREGYEAGMANAKKGDKNG